MPIRVAIVEDDPVLRASLERVVRNEGDLKWMGSYGSAEEFMKRHSGLEELDVVLMDINDRAGIVRSVHRGGGKAAEHEVERMLDAEIAK